MFEHLDDPQPPTTGDTFAVVTTRMTVLRRQRRARALLGAAGAVLVVAGAVVASQAGDEPLTSVPTGTVYDISSPSTTPPPRPVGVTGHKANLLSTTGPLDGWLLEAYPVPTAGTETWLRLGLRDKDGPTPRPVSIDFGDGTTVRPHLPPCPPPDAVPEGDRRGEHLYVSFERDIAGRPSFWMHTYDELGAYELNMVFESGCGARTQRQSTARFEFIVTKPWN